MRGRVAALVVFSVVILVCAPWIGLSLNVEDGRFIFWELRVPRALMGALVGVTMALTGAVFQTVFTNPLATPSTVGTTAGAALGALVAVVYLEGAVEGATLMPLVALAAFVGALVTTLLITLIASLGRVSSNDVLLAGIAMTLAAGAVSTGLQFQADMAATFKAIRWSLGNLQQVGYQGVLVLLPFVTLTVVVILGQTRALAALVNGEEVAHAQGVDVARTRALCLGVGAVGVGACVAWCGPISFVGLLVPHGVRLYVGASRRLLLPLSAVCGGAFLPLCDSIARVALPGRELPVGVITAALGAPLLIWLVYRQRHRGP